MSDMTRKPSTLHSVKAYVTHQILTIPNVVTTVRLVCAVLILIGPEEHLRVFVLAFVGWVSDLLDGFIAKTFGWSSEFGKRYDQYTDWSFGIALMYGIFVAGGLEWYNVPLILFIGGYLTMRLGKPTIETSEAAKVKTFLQFTGGVAILAAHAFEWTALLVAGYVLVWISLPHMARSVRDYLFPKP